jgi:hypothetical protein
MMMPTWMTARAAPGSFLSLLMVAIASTLPKSVVRLQLRGVEREVLLQLVGREDLERIVAADERGGLVALVRGDGAVGGGDERAHRHARLREVLGLVLAHLGDGPALQVTQTALERVEEAHGSAVVLSS